VREELVTRCNQLTTDAPKLKRGDIEELSNKELIDWWNKQEKGWQRSMKNVINQYICDRCGAIIPEET